MATIVDVPATPGALTAAIAAGGPNFEYHLAPGIHEEGDISIDYNNFKILGPNANINPNTGARVPEATIQNVNFNLTLARAGIEINGIKFIGTPSYYVINGSGAGDELDDSTISNNIFELALNPNKAVIHITGTTNIDNNLIIENNLFSDHLTKGTGSSSDIHISTADNITVQNNVSIDCDYAFLQFDVVTNSRVINNHISNADRKGIQLANSEGPCKNILIDGNTIINCNTEHASDHGGIRLYGNPGIENIVITNNTIKDTWNSFALHDDPFGDTSSWLTIKDNTITNSQNSDILNNAETGTISFGLNLWDVLNPVVVKGGDWIDSIVVFATVPQPNWKRNNVGEGKGLTRDMIGGARKNGNLSSGSAQFAVKSDPRKGPLVIIHNTGGITPKQAAQGIGGNTGQIGYKYIN